MQRFDEIKVWVQKMWRSSAWMMFFDWKNHLGFVGAWGNWKHVEQIFSQSFYVN